jgi:hypothetical protein
VTGPASPAHVKFTLTLLDAAGYVRRNLRGPSTPTGGVRMDLLVLLIVILLLLWLFGAFIRPFGGGLIHLLLVIVLILVIVRLL